jgi:hypothetical protein
VYKDKPVAQGLAGCRRTVGTASGRPRIRRCSRSCGIGFLNPKRLAEPFFRGTALQSQIATLPTTLTSGLYATPANAYVVGYASRLLGPDPGGHNVLVLHAKLPTHPSTFARDRVNDSGGKQVRYWSLCNYGALVVEIGTGPVLMDGCLFDEQVPTDADGFYTVVVSLPEDRPANATAQCGVACSIGARAIGSPARTWPRSSCATSSPIPPSCRASTRC